MHGITYQQYGENHHRNPQFVEYVKGLTYDDKDYFTVDEMRFLLQFSSMSAFERRTNRIGPPNGLGEDEAEEEHVEDSSENPP